MRHRITCCKCGTTIGTTCMETDQLSGICSNCQGKHPCVPFFVDMSVTETIGCADINEEILLHPERFEDRDGVIHRREKQ